MCSPAVAEKFMTTNILMHIKANMMKSLWCSKFADAFQKPIDDKVYCVFHDSLLTFLFDPQHDDQLCYVANLIVIFRMLDTVSYCSQDHGIISRILFQSFHSVFTARQHSLLC